MLALPSLSSIIYMVAILVGSFIVFWALRKKKVSEETLVQLKQILKIYRPQIPPGELKEVIDALIVVLSYYTHEGVTRKDLEMALQKLESLNLGITWQRHISKLRGDS